MSESTEAFYLDDGSIGGYGALFADWLSELFGINVQTKLFNWDELYQGLGDRSVSLTGEFTSNPERLQVFRMTSPIAKPIDILSVRRLLAEKLGHRE